MTDQVKTPNREGVASSNGKTANAPVFTTGPWGIGGDADVAILWITGQDKNANVVCDLINRKYGEGPADEDYANAHLIAAAPTMYRALASLRPHVAACDIAIIDDALSLARGETK